MTPERFTLQLDSTLAQARFAIALANEIRVALIPISERPWRPNTLPQLNDFTT